MALRDASTVARLADELAAVPPLDTVDVVSKHVGYHTVELDSGAGLVVLLADLAAGLLVDDVDRRNCSEWRETGTLKITHSQVNI